MSNPPKTISNPIKTTICIKSFFFCGKYEASREKNNTHNPIMEGMYDVNESLSLNRLTKIPQIIRKIP